MNIRIARYPVFMKLGYYPSERLTGQDVLVSLELKILNRRPCSDRLDETLNYETVFQAIDKTLKGHEVKLIETAVDLLGNALLKSFSMIQHVTVTIEKPLIPGDIAKGATISVSDSFARAVL